MAEEENENELTFLSSRKPIPPKSPSNPKYFVNASYVKLHGELYNKVFDLISSKALFFNNAKRREEPMLKYVSSSTLSKLIDFNLPAVGQNSNVLYKYMKQILEYSTHHGHPFYMGPVAGLDPYALFGEFVGSALSNNVLTFLESPVYTLMEEQVFKSIRQLIGYKDYSMPYGYGCVCPDIVFGTALVIKLAIHRKIPKERYEGLLGSEINNSDGKLVIFVSAHSAVVWTNAAVLTGIGADSVIHVEVDDTGRMNISQLKSVYMEAVGNGYTPVLVVGSVGTPTLGAIDELDELATFCQLNELWFHCHGGKPAGALIFSEQLKSKYLNGIERSDSYLINFSYALTVSSDCTVLVTKELKAIDATISIKDIKIYESGHLYDPGWNNGDRSIQTSRKPEIVKLWFCWKGKGHNGIAQYIEHVQESTDYFIQKLLAKGSTFHIVNKQVPVFAEAIFYYVPEESRGQTPQQHLLIPKMQTLSKEIQAKIVQDGKLMFELVQIPNLPTCMTLMLTNAALSKVDIRYVIDLIEYYGDQISKSTETYSLREGICEDSDDSEEEATTIKDNACITHLDTEKCGVGGLDFRNSAPKVPPPSDPYIRAVNVPIEEFHSKLFSTLLATLKAKAIYFQDHRSDSYPCNFRIPEQLLREFDFSLNPEPIYEDEHALLKLVEGVIVYSTHQAHPYFVFREHASGLDPYSIMADMFISLTSPLSNLMLANTSFWLMEKHVIKELCKCVGYNSKKSFGSFCPGGTIAGITATYMAKIEKMKTLGEYGSFKQLQLFISESGHWLFQKGANLLGIGQSNVILVKSNVDGKMSVTALAKALAKSVLNGHVPFMIVATAGTTVFGVFDNIEEISVLAKLYKCWFHIDGSKGGSLILSQNPQLRAFLKGMEISDSMNFNAHKFFGNVQLNGILLVNRDRKFLKNDVGNIFTWRSGDYPPNCIPAERRSSVLKFWLGWKAKGSIGLSQHLDYLYHLTDYLLIEMTKRGKAFQPWLPKFECPGVVFQYVPLSLRMLDFNSEEFLMKIAKVSEPLQAKLIKEGVIMVAIVSEKTLPHFLKISLTDSGLTEKDLIYILDVIDYYGKDLKVE